MKHLNQHSSTWQKCTLVAMIAGCAAIANTSSNADAPTIASMPKLEATDLYMFRSYESGRQDFVTIIANYYPLQAPLGGPDYFDLETMGYYQIHIDNTGDSMEDITFTFKFSTILEGATVPVGGQHIPIPFINVGVVGPGVMDTADVNSRQEYELTVTLGPRSSGQNLVLSHAETQATTFRKPLDNIGTQSVPNYNAYANSHIYPIALPECGIDGRVFVGQRKESFAGNPGQLFDLVNLDPRGAENAVENPLRHYNVTSLALELPIACLTSGEEPVVGAWTTSSLDLDNQPARQVSRLGFPLINELVIGLPDKDNFNTSHPVDDAQFVHYVTHPTLPYLLELRFAEEGGVAPRNLPREDLMQAIGGVPGLNSPAGVESGQFPRSEMLRLNTTTDVKPVAQQQNMGVLADDNAGFPNGRRPGDDVVDIVLRMMMGALIEDSEVAPNNTTPITDQVTVTARDFQQVFPYLNDPLSGSELR